VFSLIRSLLSNRRLLSDFVKRDLKARYVGSSMGFFWSVVFPIINLFVYLFVFRLVLKARWSDHQGPLEVALVMLAGIVVWAAFAETVSRSTNCLVENSNLIQKVVFPSEVLPVYLTISSLINMAIGLPVVMACSVYFSHFSPPDVEFYIPTMKEQLEDGSIRTLEVPRRLGEGSQVPYQVGVILTRGWKDDVTFFFETGGTATRGEDYLLEQDQAVLPSGYLRVDLLLTPIPDEDPDEGVETIELTLTGADGAGLGSVRSYDVELHDGAARQASDPAPPSTAPTCALGPEDPNYHPLNISYTVVALPILFLLQVLFTVGLGYFLSTINLFLRDTYHLVGVGVTVWMFGTPIFYPAPMVADAGYGILLMLNPMHWLIDSYRAVLLFGLWPSLFDLARLGAVSLILLWIGGGFFMGQKRRFPDLL